MYNVKPNDAMERSLDLAAELGYTGTRVYRQRSSSRSIDKVYPMEHYIGAWRYLEKPRAQHGKIVIDTST